MTHRIQRAWRGMKWSVLRHNVAVAAACFASLAWLNDCVGAMSGRLSMMMFLLSPFINFPLYCLFFLMLGAPYYFLRNLIIPPPETE